jgi:hypothetical protein
MTKPLRILITNAGLDRRSGTELYVRDLAIELLRQGHKPHVYSSQLGQVAKEIRAATIPVTDDLDMLGEPPDIIHGHHQLETVAAMLRFPTVSAIQVCHGLKPWEERPARFSRVARYVAVSEAIRDSLTMEHGIPGDRAVVIPNFVDLRRFTARSPLPVTPRRALLLSNQATPSSQLVEAVRRACTRVDVALDVVGRGMGTNSAEPEALLPTYDLVFGVGRSALEALVVGCAVVVCGREGLGSLVTSKTLDRLSSLNFGLRAQDRPLSEDGLLAEIEHYDAVDAQQVSIRIRAEAGVDRAVGRLVDLYREIISDGSAIPPAQESRELYMYLATLAERQRHYVDLVTERSSLLSDYRSLREWRDRRVRSLTWRLAARLHRVRPIGRVYDRLVRR